MTHDEALQHLQLQADAENMIDARMDRLADRAWRNADQTVNGTARSFLMEAALSQRLPFSESESGSHGTDSPAVSESSS